MSKPVSHSPGKRIYRKYKKARRAKKTKGMSIKAMPGRFTPYTFVYKTLPNVLCQALVSVPPGPGAADRGLQFRSITTGTESSVLPLNGISLIPSTGPATTTGSLSIMQPAASGFADYYDIGIATAFRLSDLSTGSSLSSQFDAYRITKVDVLVEFLSNNATVNGSGLLPTMYVYNDQDSAIPPTNLSKIVGYSGVRQFICSNKARQTFKHSCVPRIIVDSEASPSVIGPKNMWLNAGDTQVSHNAMKFYLTDVFVPNASSTQTTCIKFNFTYHVQYRAPLNLL